MRREEFHPQDMDIIRRIEGDAWVRTYFRQVQGLEGASLHHRIITTQLVIIWYVLDDKRPSISRVAAECGLTVEEVLVAIKRQKSKNASVEVRLEDGEEFVALTPAFTGGMF